jgi:hypothetical protein
MGVIRGLLGAIATASALGAAAQAFADPAVVGARGPAIGPYNAEFIAGGAGVQRPLDPAAAALQAQAPFTLTAWVEGIGPAEGAVVLVAVGRPDQPQAREIGLEHGRLFAALGLHRLVTAGQPLGRGRHEVALSFDGARLRLYQDGAEVGSADASFPAVPPPPPKDKWDEERFTLLTLAPLAPGARVNQHFAGRLGGVTLLDRALAPVELRTQAHAPPDWSAVRFDQGAKPWQVQVRQWPGYDAPQDPATLPVSKAAPGAPRAVPPYAGPALVPVGDGALAIRGGWRLLAAPQVKGAGAAISRPGYDVSAWYPAVVPGTVLTTLVARGVYPDPAYGLNNMAIPESLNRQDYWYRTVVDAPSDMAGRPVELTFEGVNYAGEVWLNGDRLGDMRGAFIRGRFDVTGRLRPGQPNVLAIRV